MLHKNLVSEFLYNAKYMLHKGGKIHITHKTSHPFSKKNIKKLAKRQSLVLVKAEFYPHLYPGYKIKRGDGLKCDESFPVGECSTFIKCILINARQLLESRDDLLAL
ncbi:Uncharacterized protein GmHk_13G036701 [Glycine max]|nr:Uncharacterized protein GmHk_13G036701 [Glycine max]